MFLIGSNNQNQGKDLDNNNHYYMAKSVFAMRLVNLPSVRSYTDQNFKIKCSFRSSKSLHLGKKKKGLKKVTETSVKHEDLDPPNFNLCLFVNEAGEEETES